MAPWAINDGGACPDGAGDWWSPSEPTVPDCPREASEWVRCPPATKNSGAHEGAPPPPTSPPVVRRNDEAKRAAAGAGGEPSGSWLLAVLNEAGEPGVEKSPEGGEKSSMVNAAAGAAGKAAEGRRCMAEPMRAAGRAAEEER